jgi:CRISPR-associated protein Cas2
MMVSTLVIYDIPEDKVRNKIAEICKDYGLTRNQWSAFFGPTDRNRREELMLKFAKRLGKNEGNIQMYVICDKDLRLRKELRVKASTSSADENASEAEQRRSRRRNAE